MKNHKGNARHRRKNRDQSTGCTTLKSNQRLTSQYRKDTIQMMRKSRGQNSREGNQQQNNPNRCSLSRTRMTAMSYCTILGRCNDSNKRHLHSRAQRIQGGSRMFQNYMCLYLSSCHHRDSEDSHRFLRTIFGRSCRMQPLYIRRWGSCNCLCTLLSCKWVLPIQHHRCMQAQASKHRDCCKNLDSRMMSIHHNLRHCGRAHSLCLNVLPKRRNNRRMLLTQSS